MENVRMDLDRLLTLACDQALLAEDEGARDPQGHAVQWATGLLTPADRLSLIADLVAGLPHGDDTDMPCLNLGSHADAHAAVAALYEANGRVGILRPTFVSTQTGCMWIEASRPKGEVSK